MNYLSVENLTKSYGDKVLFENISFGLEQGQKVALVAKNGAGKSSLLRILMGKDTPDNGSVALNNNCRIAFLEQMPEFTEEQTVIDFVLRADMPVLQVVRQYEEALDRQTTDHSPAAMKALEQAIARMDEMKAWDVESRVKQVLYSLNIKDLHQRLSEMSGGQQKRVALSRVLIEEPDLLIMDEPTNHLDLDMIEWLENYLVRSKLTLLLVTHDRYFLDRICDEILELEDGGLYRHKGNYSYYIEKKAEREQTEAAEVSKAKNLMRKELDWVRRMPKARGTKAKYRMDAFEDLKDKASSGKKEQDLELSVRMSRLGKKILEVSHLQKKYGEQVIVSDFSYVFKRMERVGIVGKNGVGKSTFLNMLTGKEQPDAGTIDVGETIVYGYYTQDGIQLQDDKRVIDVVKDIAEYMTMGDGSKISASQLLQRFLFTPEQQYAYVSTLSGGEKRRLYLLTILVKNPNFLILDEPTNDLDLVTLSTLEDFLDEFQGVLIIVSHDRYFMDKLVDHLFVFEGDGLIRDFNGKYSDYRVFADEQESLNRQAQKVEQRKEEAPVKAPSEAKKKLSFKERKEYETLEKEIQQLEEEKDRLTEQLNSGTVTDHTQLAEIGSRIGLLIEQIDEKMMRWMELDELA